MAPRRRMVRECCRWTALSAWSRASCEVEQSADGVGGAAAGASRTVAEQHERSFTQARTGHCRA
jgi:hypothetical protein